MAKRIIMDLVMAQCTSSIEFKGFKLLINFFRRIASVQGLQLEEHSHAD